MLSSFINPSCIKVGLESSEKEESFAELLEILAVGLVTGELYGGVVKIDV